MESEQVQQPEAIKINESVLAEAGAFNELPIPQMLRDNVFVVVDVVTGTSVFLATEAAAREIEAYDSKRYFYKERPVLPDANAFLREMVEQEKKRVQISTMQKLTPAERKSLNLQF